MHPATPYRRTLTLAVVVVSLVPIVAIVMSFRPQFPWQLPSGWATTPPVLWGVGICGVLMVCSLIQDRTSSAPQLVLLPAITLFVLLEMGTFTLVTVNQVTEDAKPPQIGFGGDGTEVWCNGVLLGETPFEITLDSFNEKVKPLQQPPEQDVKINRMRNGYSFKSAQWSAIPHDPNQIFDPIEFRETPAAIMKQFSKQKYFWSFRRGRHVARASGLNYSGGLDAQSFGIGYWESLKVHADLLKQLAAHEGVDMATAYADHLANYPGLKRWLDEKPKPDIAPIDIEQFIDHNSSPEQLSFNEAVWREDWRWLARSNDPRSVPLLRKYIANHLDLDSPARSSIHSIEKSFLANLMESRQPEIQATVREIMSGADWTSQDLLHYYIDRQIEAGVSREELTAWYGQLDFGSMSDHCLPLLIKCGGKNMADYLPPVSDWRHLHGGFPKPVVRWIANEWTENRSVDLYRIISRRPVPETVRDALSKTDLGTTEKAREFIEMMYRTAAPSGVVRDALAEATSTAFRQASDQDHISALAEAFELLPTETALSALEDYDGPKNEKVDQYLQNVKAAIKANKALNKHQIQQARDLIAGKTGPEDLIATRRFQWVNDRYVEVTNP